MPRRAGDRHSRENPLGISRCPFQDLHRPHRATDHAEQLIDAEMIQQQCLCADHVADGNDGKIQPPGFARFRIEIPRACGPQASAEHVNANDEVSFRIERFARPHHQFPPAGLAGDGIFLQHVLVSGQGVTDEHGVRFVGIQFAAGGIGGGKRTDGFPGIETHGLVPRKLHLKPGQSGVGIPGNRGDVAGRCHRQKSSSRSGKRACIARVAPLLCQCFLCICRFRRLHIAPFGAGLHRGNGVRKTALSRTRYRPHHV